MLYEVLQRFEVEAPNEETAKLIIQKLQEKNQQGLFLRHVSASMAYGDKSIWKLW
jgi:hypothetical protein